MFMATVKPKKQTRHSPDNDTWQIYYERYTADDFRAILAEDARLKLFLPHVRQAIEALLEHRDSWGDVARSLGLSISSAQDKIRYAVKEFKKRQNNPNYQPRHITRELKVDNVNEWLH
jgi:hypothetical protein